MKVLIADGSETSRMSFGSCLTNWGYEAVVAENGAEAWQILAQPDCPSMTILDWFMPEMTGPELCRKVRERRREPYTYILLLTSNQTRDETVDGLQAGADDYIVKPFEENELHLRLRAAERIVRLQKELIAQREKLRDAANNRLW